MAQSQTSFRTDNCDECCGEHDVRHCRLERLDDTVHGKVARWSEHRMLCIGCRSKPRHSAMRVVNLRGAA